MFEMLRAQSRSAFGAILYVTVGVLMMIWAGLYYYFYLSDASRPSDWQNFLCVGTLLSGLAVAAIGLLFGLIGGTAKGADTNVGVAPAGPVAPVIGTGVPAAGVVNAAPVGTAAVGGMSR